MFKQIRPFFVAAFLTLSINSAQAQFYKKFFAPPDSAVKQKRHRVLGLPVVSRSPETDWAFGFAGTWFFKTDMKDSTTRTSNLQLISIYTLRKQFVAQVDGNFVLPGERFYIKLHSSFSRYPDRFWGIGNNTPNSNMERFSFQQFHINPLLMVKIKPRFFVGLDFDMQKFYKLEYPAGGLFETQHIPGRYGSFISGAGLLVLYDNRDNFYNAYKGWYAQFININYGKWMGSQYTYSQYIFDVRKYFKLYKSHVIALQGYFEYNGPGEVPFRNLARMGGPERMRGYFSGRYSDKAHMCYQAEYRFPIWWRIGGTAFASAGQVADKIKNFKLNEFKYTYGFGLRFMANRAERINLRVDFGFRKGGGDYYFTIAEAF